jgi:hypothetical protein
LSIYDLTHLITDSRPNLDGKDKYLSEMYCVVYTAYIIFFNKEKVIHFENFL